MSLAVEAFAPLKLYSHGEGELWRSGGAGQKPDGCVLTELEKPLFCGLVC